MSSYVSNLVHFVWGTKDRRPLIKDYWKDRLYGYIGGVLKNKKASLLAAGGMSDHVHVLASLPSTVTLAQIANAMKANSSRWIHEELHNDRFSWQEGYGAFSVSKSGEHRVIDYIKNQEEHHRQQTFEEEKYPALTGGAIPCRASGPRVQFSCYRAKHVRWASQQWHRIGANRQFY